MPRNDCCRKGLTQFTGLLYSREFENAIGVAFAAVQILNVHVFELGDMYYIDGKQLLKELYIYSLSNTLDRLHRNAA